MQRFELGGAKFWHIDVNGSTMVTGLVKAGGQPELKVQEFANQQAAIRAREKLIAEKLAKGWREIKEKKKAPKAAPKPAAARRASDVDPNALVVKEIRAGGGRCGRILIDGKRVMMTGEQCLVSSNGKNFHRRTTPGTCFSLVQHGDAIYSIGGPFMVTRDFGQTWKELPYPEDPYYKFCIHRDSRGTWWLGADDGALFTATDIEAGWNKARVQGTGKILDIVEVDDRLFFFGYGSHVLKGSSLEKLKGIDKEHIICRCTETPSGVLVAIGDGGITYRSTDRGATWKFVKSGVRDDLEELAWVAGTLFCVGGDGTILKTTDDGESWTKIETGTSQHLWGITSYGDGALIGGNYGIVMSLAAPSDNYWAGTTDDFAPPPPTIDPSFEPQRAAAAAERERVFAELYAAASAEHDRISVKAGLSRPRDANPRLAKLVEEAADDDTTSSQVYADWLQGEGDPRGELAAVQLRRAHDRKNKELKKHEKELLAAHADRLLGKLVPAKELLKLKWHAGFIHSAKIHNTSENGDDGKENDKHIEIADVVSWLLDEPSARFLRKLTLGIVTYYENNYEECAARIGQRYLPALRELFIGDFDIEDTELSWSELGDVEALYAALPNLKKLTLRSGSMTLGQIVLPKLEAFEVITGGLDPEDAAALCAAKWPSLKSLSIQIGAEDYGGDADVEDFRPIFDGVGLPRLEHLGLKNTEISERLIEPLATSKILPQLKSIDLGMGTLGDEGVQTIFRFQKAFAHLERIDLEDNFVTREGERLLAQTKLNVHIGEQRDDEGDPSNRYASSAE